MQEGKMMDKQILAQLEKITGRDGVLTSPEDLAVYSYDGTFEEGCPEVVVLPRTTEQVSQVVRASCAERVYRWYRGEWARGWQAGRCRPWGESCWP
jgi:hypothetical protein